MENNFADLLNSSMKKKEGEAIRKSFRTPKEYSRQSQSSFKKGEFRSSNELSINKSNSSKSFIEEKLSPIDSEHDENVSHFEVNPTKKVGMVEFLRDLNFTKHKEMLEENIKMKLILTSAVWVLEGFNETHKDFIRFKHGHCDPKDSLSDINSGKVKTLIPKPFMHNSSKSDLYSK